VPALTIGDVEIDEFVELFTASLRTVEDALVLEGSTQLGTSSEVSA
jgi:acetylornithine aminotransferase